MNSYFLYFYVHIDIILIYCRHVLLPRSRTLIKLCVILTVTVVSNVQLQQQVIKEMDKMLEVIKNVSRTVFSIH